MEQLIQNFPQQLKKSVEISQNVKCTQTKNPIHNIVVAGMGGSGIGGDLVQAMTGQDLEIPFFVNKNYRLPNFVNENTLFIASSFSGNTEETLAVLQQAIEKQAKICCITAGGKALEIAQTNNFDFVQLPNEAPCPRAFVGYSFVQILGVLKGYGLIKKDFAPIVNQSANALINTQYDLRIQAKEVAKFMFEKEILVYADDLFLALLTRLQQQVNENSKQLCHINIFPELNHNELVGWGLSKEKYENVALLLLRSSLEHERVSVRIKISKEIFTQKTNNLLELEAKGANLLEQSIYLIHLFDWISYYLADLNKVDAFEIEPIIYLKNELAKY